jgi:ABC-type dipeptide/oligopeptide/nickel transport system ATPase component
MGSPAHEYTKGLIACIPRLGQRRHRLTTLKDELKVS